MDHLKNKRDTLCLFGEYVASNPLLKQTPKKLKLIDIWLLNSEIVQKISTLFFFHLNNLGDVWDKGLSRMQCHVIFYQH